MYQPAEGEAGKQEISTCHCITCYAIRCAVRPIASPVAENYRLHSLHFARHPAGLFCTQF